MRVRPFLFSRLSLSLSFSLYAPFLCGLGDQSKSFLERLYDALVQRAACVAIDRAFPDHHQADQHGPTSSATPFKASGASRAAAAAAAAKGQGVVDEGTAAWGGGALSPLRAAIDAASHLWHGTAAPSPPPPRRASPLSPPAPAPAPAPAFSPSTPAAAAMAAAAAACEADGQCAICLTALAVGAAKALPCGHALHRRCLRTLLGAAVAGVSSIMAPY